MNNYFANPSVMVALAISLIIPHVISAETPVVEPHESAKKPSHRTYVYAKIILPMKAPDKGKHPVVESWIAKDLRKRGETKLRAVTDWVRLGEGGENDALIWMATVDGKYWGCPVEGRVAERTADGKIKVDLSGWSPAGAEVKGDILAAETGSRGIVTVDTGRIDQDGRAFVALIIGPGRAVHEHAQENLASIPWRDFSPATLKELRSRNQSVLVFCRAEWDVTPKILERTLFRDKRVIDAVNQLEYVPLRADFTKPSKEIEGFLRDVGARPGEATIVVFHGPNDQIPIVLQMKSASKFISTADLLDAIKPAGKGKN